MITLEMFTKVFYVLGFDLTPDKEADEEHVYLVKEMCALRHALKTTTRTRHLHFVCLIPRTR